jgi:predicted Zn-dependent protease
VAIAAFPTKKAFYVALFQLEKAHGSKEAADLAMATAVEAKPNCPLLWLMWAKELWARVFSIEFSGKTLMVHAVS